MSITQTITSIGDAPTKQDPATFDDRADAVMTVLENWGGATGEVNVWADQANALAVTVNGYKTDAQTAKTGAESAQTAAEAARDAAAISANVTVWSVGVTYAAGAIVTDPADDYSLYTSQQAGNTGNTPNTDDGTWWEPTIVALPDQAGNDGKYLQTDGTDASWADVPSIDLLQIQVFS